MSQRKRSSPRSNRGTVQTLPLETMQRVRNIEQRQRNLLDTLRRAIQHDRSNNKSIRLVTAAYKNLNAEKMRLIRRAK